MIEWFKSLPKTIFVMIVIGAGILFIVISDPPRTVCDSQIEAFKKTTDSLLGLNKIKNPNRKETRLQRLIETCKSTNSPGGCYELFASIKQTTKDIRTVSPECYGKLSSDAGVKEVIWQSLELMVKIAWGTKPPEAVSLKSGWLDPSDLNLFCELKKAAIDLYSLERWNAFMEPYFQSLPGATALGRAETWQRMLFSTNCGAYL